MMEIIDYYDEPHETELVYYYSEKCPICKRFVRIVDELDVRLVIPIDRVNIDTRRDRKYQWWHDFCRYNLKSRTIVPALVFWQEGFERGHPHIIALEKQYTGVVTKNIEERIAVLSEKLMKEFERYMYRQVMI